MEQQANTPHAKSNNPRPQTTHSPHPTKFYHSAQATRNGKKLTPHIRKAFAKELSRCPPTRNMEHF